MSRETTAPQPVARDLLDRVLQPYRENCRYVQDATLRLPATRPIAPADADSHVLVEGRCHIPSSCYIDDTGHFNAVELNITYNQLLYTGLAVTCANGLIEELPWDVEDFFVHQLPDVLILDYHARFRRPLDARAFRATFAIREVMPKPNKDMVLIRTFCAASCASGGDAEAEVVVALVNARGEGR